MNFWNNPTYNGVKVLLVTVAIAGAGFFVYNFTNAPLSGKATVLNTSQMTASTPTTAVAGTTLLPSLNVGAAPTGSLAAAIKVLYVQGVSMFVGNLGIRGQLGVTQSDGSTLSPASGGNTIYVQGIPVCLQNGVNCPTTKTATPSAAVVQYTNIGIGTAPSWEPLAVNGQSIFWNDPNRTASTFPDPEVGVSTALKASSAAFGSAYVENLTVKNSINVYLVHNNGSSGRPCNAVSSDGKTITTSFGGTYSLAPFTMTTWAYCVAVPGTGAIINGAPVSSYSGAAAWANDFVGHLVQ